MRTRSSEEGFERLPTLPGAFYAFVALSAAVAALAILVLMQERARHFESQVQLQAVGLRGQALRVTLTDALEREWNSLGAVSRNLNPRSVQSMQGMFDTVVQAGGRVL